MTLPDVSQPVILDLGISNVSSLENALWWIGRMPQVIYEADEVHPSATLIVPGVGSFDRGMERMRDTGFGELLRVHSAQGGPILGICLGMQLLSKSSTEGTSSGVGLLDCKFESFEANKRKQAVSAGRTRDMNMGLRPVFGAGQAPSKLISALSKSFYFVHRFRTKAPPELEWGTSIFGEKFSAIVGAGKTVGVQFHPEKSGRRGLDLLDALLTVGS